MKKFFAVIFLLISGLLVFLATVDLEPYLIHNQADIPDDIALAPVLKADDSPTETKEINLEEKQTLPQLKPEDTQGNQGDKSFKKTESETPLGPTTTTQEPPELTATSSSGQADKLANDEKLEQISSPLVELEALILPVSEYPYSILLETFLEQESAQQGLSLYKEKGIAAHWVKVGLGEHGIRYRLFTGAFGTEAEAQQYLDKNNLPDKLIKKTSFSSRVGVYMDKAQLAGAFIKTQEVGVIPYILGTKKGDYYLYVGAFYTLAGATNKCHFLVKAGLSCEPVRRSTIPPQQN